MDRTEKILSKFESLEVDGTPTEVICSNYGNRVLLLVTNFNKVGTLVSNFIVSFHWRALKWCVFSLTYHTTR